MEENLSQKPPKVLSFCQKKLIKCHLKTNQTECARPASPASCMDGKKARGAERLRLDHAERPASDTDDTMWEELLQGPDSVSTGSSDTEGEAWRYRAGVNGPPTATVSSDDEKLQQVSRSHLFIFVFISDRKSVV